MPRISPLAKAATLAACAEAVSDASNLSRMKSGYSGFGEGVCTCARCMRRAGPIREDVENKLVQITYALANVYDDSPDLEVRVTDEHRARAEEMMACVESGDVGHLRDSFLEVEEAESEGVLEGGTATEIATYLIISAAQVGQPEVIRLLAEWDADMEETDSIRRGRPLMHAANNGHTAAVKALVDCGADPEATDDNGYTALMVAVFSDRSSAAEALVEGGAAVDTADRAGRTALSYAAMYGSTDCIYLLAARGADVAHVDHDGNTPLELAEGSGRQSAVDALKKLQLRVKMQEKRKVKQSKCRPGCLDLDAEQLQAKEQEAARAAAELLEELEKEEAARSAKEAKGGKKKKKGKSKSAAHDAASDTAEQPQQEPAPDPAPAAQEAAQAHRAGAGGRQRRQQQQPQQQPQQPASPSHDSAATAAAWPSQEAHGGGEHDDGAKASTEAKQQPRKQPKQAPAASPGSGGGDADSHAGSTQGDDAAPAPPPDPAAAELEALRREWEALLEQAARCRDPAAQPVLLERVSGMLSRCAESGISVKYGRKVLQRLQAVGPARAALQAALAAEPRSCAELEAALGACKSCRCLLEEELVGAAEELLAGLLEEAAAEARAAEAERQQRLAEAQQQQRRRLEELEQQQRDATAVSWDADAPEQGVLGLGLLAQTSPTAAQQQALAQAQLQAAAAAAAAQHGGLQPPGSTTAFLQQQLRALHTQQQHQQHQQHAAARQLQQEQLLASPLQLLAQGGGGGAPVSSAPSLLAAGQQQALSQLQLLQQQQLFASQRQGGQLQRGLGGMASLLSPSPGGGGGGGMLGTSPGGMLHPQLGLAPASQAQARLAQAAAAQQLAAGFWPRPGLVAPGSFGSVGQPMVRSPVGSGRLSLDLVTPPPSMGPGGAALARRDSMGSGSLAPGGPLLGGGGGGGEPDVLDDHAHPAYAMANALLSDDERDTGLAGGAPPGGEPCAVCRAARCDTACVPCGCRCVCQRCAGHWKQRGGEAACPLCSAALSDFVVLS
ncbi:TANC1 [Scenedesmus sp. PABB004]|nr:TANC1 [Scenedesmus sp. PABB004]